MRSVSALCANFVTSPQTPPTLPNYEKWEYWGSGIWKCLIFVQLGVNLVAFVVIQRICSYSNLHCINVCIIIIIIMTVGIAHRNVPVVVDK